MWRKIIVVLKKYNSILKIFDSLGVDHSIDVYIFVHVVL